MKQECIGKALKSSDSISLKQVKIKDDYWSEKIDLVRKVVIPYQWEVLNDRVIEAAPSHVIKNLRIAAGLETGEFEGFFFQDTDLAKWLEAVSYCIMTKPDQELESLADQAILLIEKAQQEDGYLNSYFTVKEKDKRWTNLEECHELYTAGHFIEAGVAYYEATGKERLLNIVCKLADCIDSVFGPEPTKLHGYDGHQEIELALIRLFHITGKDRYRNLSKYFIDERGREPYYFISEWENRNGISAWSNQKSESPAVRRKYIQTHMPVRQQTIAVGHAVRVVYMLIGMIEVANIYNDKELLNSCKVLWENITTKQMYITGGIGATHAGEAFTFDYDLPNDTVYAETCASIGLIMFAQKMLEIEPNRSYSDIIERALFNIIIGSMSKDGKHFFYVNPLEVWPEASKSDAGKQHVKIERQKWFGCACCPPNVARLLSSLGKYIYTVNEATLYVHQFIGSEVKTTINNQILYLKQESNYPFKENVRITLSSEDFSVKGALVKEDLSGKETKVNNDVIGSFTIGIRIPSWCREAAFTVDGEEVSHHDIMQDGYVMIHNTWNNGSVIELRLSMPVELIYANPKVRENLGKVAIQRGPMVYCLEEIDNGENLPGICLKSNTHYNLVRDTKELSGAVTILFEGERDVMEGEKEVMEGDNYKGQSDILYQNKPFHKEKVMVKAVPYCMWGNRKSGEMLVWIRQSNGIH